MASDPQDLTALTRAATPRILAALFRHGGFDFGGRIFSVDSLHKAAPPGNHCLRYQNDHTWCDSLTGKSGNGIVSFVAYAKGLSPGAAGAIVAKMIQPGDRWAGRTIRARDLLDVSDADAMPRDQDLTSILGKRHLSPRERADALFQAELSTRHSRFDK